VKKQLYYLDGHKLIPMLRKNKFWDIMVCVCCVYWAGEVLIGEPCALIYWASFCAVMILAHMYSIRWANYWLRKHIIIEELDDTAQLCPGSKRKRKDCDSA
jgi:hypothetical protein